MSSFIQFVRGDRVRFLFPENNTRYYTVLQVRDATREEKDDLANFVDGKPVEDLQWVYLTDQESQKIPNVALQK